MASIITIAGEQLFAQKAQNNQQLDIDTFIFANVPGQNSADPIDRNEAVPVVGQQVHTQIVQQVGRINDNVVVYSTVLDSVTGDFDFNWVGLYSSVNDTLVAINHIPTTTKTATNGNVAGNTLNRNFGIEYSGIAELTGITVAPETWQLDFTARLAGMDELTRQLASDMNGKDWFIDNGFKVEARETVNTFKVLPGVGYANGLRVEQDIEHVLNITEYPKFVYVDAYFDGDASSTWKPQHSFTVSDSELSDYTDANGKQHYVVKLAHVISAENVENLREQPEIIKLERKLSRGAIAFTQGVMSKLQAANENIRLLILGDSTGNESFEWVYKLLNKLALEYPAYSFSIKAWDTTTNAYLTNETISTGSGVQTFTCYNASVPGEEASYFKGEIYGPTTNIYADLCIVNFGHNGLSDPITQRAEMAALTCRMADDYPDRPIILIGQNPNTTDNEQQLKIHEFRQLCAQENYGFIDVHSTFKKYAVPLENYMSDTVHPNSEGMELWAETVKQSFNLLEGAAAGQNKQTMARTLIYSAFTKEEFDTWLNTNVSITKDSTELFYETDAGSAKLVSDGAGNISKDVISAKDIVRWRGKWVTVAARIRVPNGEVPNCGLLALYDTNQTKTSFVGGPQGDSFYWQVTTIKVDEAAPFLRVKFYTDTAATGGTVYLDRLTVCSGKSPMDYIPPELGQYLRQISGLDIFGSNPDGLIKIRNSDVNGSDYGIVFLSEVEGTDEDDPRTQYTMSLGGDLIKLKKRSDAFDRIRIYPRTGEIWLGDGTQTPAIKLSANGNNLLKLKGATLYNDDNDTHDLGLSNKAWRRGYINDLKQGLTTGGAASAGVGKQYVELKVDGVVYKVLHDGTV